MVISKHVKVTHSFCNTSVTGPKFDAKVTLSDCSNLLLGAIVTHLNVTRGTGPLIISDLNIMGQFYQALPFFWPFTIYEYIAIYFSKLNAVYSSCSTRKRVHRNKVETNVCAN